MSDDGMTVKPPATPAVAVGQQSAQSARPRTQAQAPVQAPAPTQAKPKQEPADIEAVAKQLESFLKRVSRSLEFRVAHAADHAAARVADVELQRAPDALQEAFELLRHGDLIRQIP